MANGDRVSCRGLAKDVAIRIGEEYFTMDCYTIPLACYDMVLGVSFLRTLGPILWDFDDLCMAFWHFGKRVLWKGIGSTRWDIPSTSTLHSLSKDDRPAPAAVRPYRSLRLHKDELMLKQGIIRPSTSPFSAPVLLDRLLEAQDHAQNHYDAKHRPLHFVVGDWVWLRTPHRPLQSLLPGTRGKLSPRYAGPFQLLQRIVDVAKWTGLADADAMWESVTNFCAAFPDFQLEDELFPEGGRDVMGGRAYERRSRD